MRTQVIIIGGGALGLWLLQVFSWSLTMMMPLPRCLGL
jgi:hypothetical protein